MVAFDAVDVCGGVVVVCFVLPLMWLMLLLVMRVLLLLFVVCF